MTIKQHYLGWEKPALRQAVTLLRDSYDRGPCWDMANLIIAVPVARAGRRLLELLAQASPGRALAPPQVVTVGQLPEHLYESPTPPASPLEAMLTRIAALRHADQLTLQTVLGTRPPDDDFNAWWMLARQLDDLAGDLATSCLRVGDVEAAANKAGIDLTTGLGQDRWGLLNQLDENYHHLLAQAGKIDPQKARLDAIAQHRCSCAKHIILLATADLSPMLASMLRQVDTPISTFIHAPIEHADGFDQLGALRAAYWQKQHIDLDDAAIEFVDRPSDMATCVVQRIEQANQQQEDGFAADQITVGLGDEELAGAIRRALEMCDLPARYAGGRKLCQSRPAMLLRALERFAGEQRFDDLADLLRHPDVESYVQGVGHTTSPRQTAQQWLTLLDQYAQRHMQSHLDAGFIGDSATARQLQTLRDRVVGLLPEAPSQRMALPLWSRPILEALRRVYGPMALRRYDRIDDQLIGALTAIAQALRDQAKLDPYAPATPKLTVAEAIGLTLDRLQSHNIPEPGGESAIELMGFLELPLDDAPLLVITSMNEGYVPQSHNADAFLPNSLRSTLGLADNAHRYGRDMLALHAIIHSKRTVTLIAGRHSATGDPLAPSRLLLACDDQTLTQRITRFYQSSDDAHQQPAPPLLLCPGKADMFLLPRPLLDQPILDRLPVTAFADYLACPYRFYLRHVLKLGALDDQAVELDGAAFGSLAHSVLEAFGREEKLVHVTDEQTIARFLSAKLDDIVRTHFGPNHRPALRVQTEQLRQRLFRFATRQVAWTKEGWRIRTDLIEKKHTATIQVDGKPFTISGKIDRIDQHAELGYRILDYKTSDTPLKPEKAHRSGPQSAKQWINLQLPLYRNLAGALDIDGDVQLGYINLPKKLDAVDLSLASWSREEIDEAMTVRDEVIAAVRGQIFWPPKDPPRYVDDFTRICADHALERSSIVKASAEVLA